MKTYEVFLKRPGKDPFAHVGALEAPDDDLALSFARDCYARPLRRGTDVGCGPRGLAGCRPY